MSEAELVQHFWSGVENGFNSLTIYISVFSGYLLVAYLIGARLTSLQCAIATGAFLVFGGYCIWGSTVFWNVVYVAALELRPVRAEFLPIDLNPAYLAFVLLFIGMLGAKKFMWDVRHTKAE